jgi:CRISPR-associated endonuclease/helicase Cas3
MAGLRYDRFGEFFLALNGVDPFPWQRRLAERVCTGQWPAALALPTASGKTACIDVAIFALACQADHPPNERTAPRRIAFVVDRRIIVDEAFERARRVAKALRKGTGLDGVPRPILFEVALALRKVGGLSDDEDPLVCAQLRGGIYRDASWAATPTQPTVLCSTVDQIGSRLLFRGYGVSDSLKPVHAGLAGNDCLILLDEAHCARPFARTAVAVREYRRWSENESLALPFHFAILSATPPPGFRDDAVRLEEDDLQPDALGPRVLCSKPAELVIEQIPGGARGRDKLADRLVNHASRLVNEFELRAVAILVNRVDTARLVSELCRRRWPEAAADVLCLTGRMRPYDRDKVVGSWRDRLRPAKDRPPLDRPVFVVATQCLEVGANLDFEGLVTECASLDALRQRFGRLKRLGLGPDAHGVIVMQADRTKTEDEMAKEPPGKKDPIYGDALPRTWNWMWEHGQPSNRKDGQESRVIDFGIAALDAVLPDNPEELRDLQAPSTDSPVMLPAHIDCWVQTATQPDPDPDVALFLHGPERGVAEVRVCWRADLNVDFPNDQLEERWKNAVALCPPTVAECTPVPLPRMRAWLSGDPKAMASDDAGSDIDPASPPLAPSEDTDPQRHALRWRGPEDPATGLIKKLGDLRPGDTLVLPASDSSSRNLGQFPDESMRDVSEWGVDIAEQTNRLARRRAALRLLPQRIERWPKSSVRQTLLEIVHMDLEEVSGDELREALSELVAEESSLPDDLRQNREFLNVLESLASDDRTKILPHPNHPSGAPDGLSDSERDRLFPGGLVLIGSMVLPRFGDEDLGEDVVTTEDDTASATETIALDDHCKGVAELADRYARCFGLSETVRRSVVAAAEWHDFGKADGRFQAWLLNGNARAARMAPRPLAKSEGLPQGPSQRERARIRSRYPRGARHELVSVRLAEHLVERLDPGVDGDLVLHLIASHHGHARPFAPVVEDDDPVEVTLNLDGDFLRTSSSTELHRLDSGVAERFWVLVRRYGWWGLAWLESLLRLADQQRSKLEQGNSRAGRGRS